MHAANGVPPCVAARGPSAGLALSDIGPLTRCADPWHAPVTDANYPARYDREVTRGGDRVADHGGSSLTPARWA